MKQGIILVRKHGAGAFEALAPAGPYHLAVALFKEKFQTGERTHKEYDEVLLAPIESDNCKRVKFITVKRDKEIKAAIENAQEAAKRAAKLSDETKRAMANVSAANAKLEHLENAYKTVSANPNPEYKENAIALVGRIESAKAELKKAKALLASLEKSDAEKAKPKAPSKVEAQPSQTESK